MPSRTPKIVRAKLSLRETQTARRISQQDQAG